MGVTIENNKYLYRADLLRKTNACIKFVSAEPLLGEIDDINLEKIDWIIVGGESGPGARPMEKEWVLSIREIAKKSGTAFFFKQWGGTNKKKAGRLLEGKTYDEYPSISNCNAREFPFIVLISDSYAKSDSSIDTIVSIEVSSFYRYFIAKR